jgi:hypothetical protein
VARKRDRLRVGAGRRTAPAETDGGRAKPEQHSILAATPGGKLVMENLVRA